MVGLELVQEALGSAGICAGAASRRGGGDLGAVFAASTDPARHVLLALPRAAFTTVSELMMKLWMTFVLVARILQHLVGLAQRRDARAGSTSFRSRAARREARCRARR